MAVVSLFVLEIDRDLNRTVEIAKAYDILSSWLIDLQRNPLPKAPACEPRCPSWVGQSRHFDRVPVTSGPPRLADILGVRRQSLSVALSVLGPPPI
jgi:hypothetical protein